MTRTLPTLTALLALAGSPARAGETVCWFENGVVVVPAEVLGVAADFILDTASPHTQLADSQAQAAGYEETALTGTIRLAGETIEAAPVAVAALDLRTGALPTPVAGVIGADVLRAYVLDVSFRPCRVALNPKTGFRAAAALPIAWLADRPVIQATVSDGRASLTGAFSLGVGADRAVRLSDATADAPGAVVRKELYPYGVLQPRLAYLSFAGSQSVDLPAGLMPAEDPALLGQLGSPFLSRYRLRFDFPAGKLRLAPYLTHRDSDGGR